MKLFFKFSLFQLRFVLVLHGSSIPSMQGGFPESGAAVCGHDALPDFSRTATYLESGGPAGRDTLAPPRHVPLQVAAAQQGV